MVIKISNDSDTSEVFDSYRKERNRRGVTEKLREENLSVVNKSDIVEDFKAFKDSKESYVFRVSDHFECKFLLNEKIEKGKLIFSVNDDPKVCIYSKKIDEKNDKYEIIFDTDTLLLFDEVYNILLFDGDNKLIEDLKIEVKEGEMKFGKYVILKDPIEKSDFPHGKFYIFGSLENIIERYNKGEICVTVFPDESNFDLGELESVYDEGQILSY